jgi:hypothetical protein
MTTYVATHDGPINAREREAGEMLRDAIEQSQRVSRSEVHVAPWSRMAASERQLKACCRMRSALAGLDNTVTPSVLWVVHGGKIRGYAAFAHLRHATAAELLRRGLGALALGALADHYRLAMPRAV